MGVRGLVLFIVFACPAIALAEAKPVAEDRLVLTGGLGMGGDVTIKASNDSPTSTVTSGGRAGGTAGVQYEWAAVPYLSLAGRFGITRFDWDEDRSNMRTWMDISAVPTFTFAIGAGKVFVEPRLGAMLGMSLYLWNAEDSLVIYNDRIRRTNVGWNLGGVGGVLIRARNATGFLSHLGGTVEFGYVHRAAYANGRTSDLHVSVVHDQFLLQAGIAISLK